MSKLNRESGRMRSAYKEALKEEPPMDVVSLEILRDD